MSKMTRKQQKKVQSTIVIVATAAATIMYHIKWHAEISAAT